MLADLVAGVLNLPPLVYAVVGLVTVWYLTTRSNNSVPANIPPFPARPYPVLGHLFMLGSDPVRTFHDWTKSTGEIFSLFMGPDLIIVMNSFRVLKESLVKQADIFSDRNETFSGKALKKNEKGIIGNSGPDWKEQRTVSMSILRNFGMGKNFLAEKITEEIDEYLKEISGFKGQPTDIRLLTNTAVSNVICALLIGKRFDFEDPYFVQLIKLLHEQVKLLGSTSILLNCFPWLQYLPGDFFNAKIVRQNNDSIRGHFSKKFMQETMSLDEDERIDNFINAYYTELKKKEKGNVPTYLCEENLKTVVSNLFVAGTETTSTTLMWAVIFATHYPDAQDKVYKEIVEVASTARLPSIQDRPKMVYTNAYIMETQRLGSIVPFSLSHKCTATTTVAGYTIPKGATIIPNLEEVLKDPEAWGDPLVFRPERFLDKGNTITVPEQFIPFGIGRRTCMGESLARMELFLFLCGIFQRFHILPEDPDLLPPLEPVFGITCAPKSFRSKLVERT